MSKLDPRNFESKVSDSKSADAKSPDIKSESAGRFAYDGLDRVIHEKARLSVLTSLVAHPKGLVFGDLKQMCGLTDGNLSRHLQVLDEARLIAIEKGYDHNRPQTICRITAQGRRRYLEYLKVLEQVVQDAALAAGAGSARGTARGLAPLSTRRFKLA
jgi:DNA-binding MarR family transcriptional regulator